LAAPAGGRFIILLVEDNPAIRRAYGAALEGAGHRVIVAENGRDALERVVTNRPDLILQDLGLPDMDGFELLRRFRALPEMASLPIVAISGVAARDAEVQTGAAGFAEFLAKPVALDSLFEAVARHLPG
jgi:CheY-like chemotaxis protein